MTSDDALRRVGILACVAAAFVACASGSGTPRLVYATGAGSATEDGLHRIRWSQLGAEYVRPGADLRGFSQVLIDPLTIAEKQPEGRRRMGPTRTYAPTPAYLEGMQRTYHEALSKVFARDGWSVVTEPGPGVLRVSGHVIDLVLTARLDPEQDPNTNEFVRSFGDLTLLLDVRDSVSGIPLLRAVDREAISRNILTGAFRNTTGENLSAQRELFGHQALLLRQEIVKLQRIGSLPAPGS